MAFLMFNSFLIFATGFAAAGIFIFRNVIFSLLSLILVFLFSSAFLFTLPIPPFIALSFLLIYVGAIAVLFLFVLMLIDLRPSSEFNSWSLFLFPFLVVVFCFFPFPDSQLSHSVTIIGSAYKTLDLPALSSLFSLASVETLFLGVILLIALFGAIGVAALHPPLFSKHQNLVDQMGANFSAVGLLRKP